VALHDLDFTAAQAGEKSWLQVAKDFTGILGKARRQIVKDYILWPALSGPSFLTTLAANATANVVRNVWAYAIIFCGHFPDQT
jgi:NADPH-dependent stearoyl-CoA 9-desaturase